MPGLLIRELPEDLHQKLRKRAARNRRSLSKEAMVILESALGTENLIEATEALKPFRGRFRLTDDWINQAKREGRL